MPKPLFIFASFCKKLLHIYSPSEEQIICEAILIIFSKIAVCGGRKMKDKKCRALSALCALALILCAFLGLGAHNSYINDGTGLLFGISIKDAKISSRLLELLFTKDSEECFLAKSRPSSDNLSLIVGGELFGARIKQARLTVSEADEALGLCEGDILISLGGMEIFDTKDVKAALDKAGGGKIKLVCQRGKHKIERTLTPQKVGSEWRLGILLRDGAAGIGTVTYINPETLEFGGLGHGICEPDSHIPVEMSTGVVTGVILGGVEKGTAGKPGELCGILTDKRCGEVYSNTECGVFGRLDKTMKADNQAIPVAKKASFTQELPRYFPR